MNLNEAGRLLNLPLNVEKDKLDSTLAAYNADYKSKIDGASSHFIREKHQAALDRINAAGELLRLARSVYQPGLHPGSAETAAPFSKDAAPSPASPSNSPRPNPPASKTTPAKVPQNSAAQTSSRRVYLVALALFVLAGGAGAAFFLKNREATSTSAADVAAFSVRLESARARWARLETEAAAAERAITEIAPPAPGELLAGKAPELAESEARRRAWVDFVAWVRPFLDQHPAKAELQRFASFAAAPSQAAASETELALNSLLDGAEKEIMEQKSRFLTLVRPVSIASEPSGLRFTVNDAYGRRVEGVTPAKLDVPFGLTRLTVSPPGAESNDWEREFTLDRDSASEAVEWKAAFTLASVRIESAPAGLPYELSRAGGKSKPVTGLTPADLEGQATGAATLRVSRPGWPDKVQAVEIVAPTNVFNLEFVAGSLDIRSEPSNATVSSDGQALGKTPLTLPDLIPGEHSYRVELLGHESATLQTQVNAGEVTLANLALKPTHNVKAGEPYTVPELGLVLMPIPAGNFVMGTPSGDPTFNSYEAQHLVVISRDFWLGKYEVTRAEWLEIMESYTPGTPPSAKPEENLIPVTRVSWADATAFCRALTARERAAGRLPDTLEFALPTEAQWEYACRAGTQSLYGGTGNLDELGWFQLNSGGEARRRGEKKANAWGLHDMHGNVWEWCADWFQLYPLAPANDPVGPPEGSGRVTRGGGWGSAASACRSASRLSLAPTDRTTNLGFRIALSQIVAPASAVPIANAKAK